MTNGNSARSGARTPPEEDPTDDDKYAVIDDTGVDTVEAAPIAGAVDGAQHYDPASS